MDELWLRMVKIQITGPNSYKWLRSIAVVRTDVEDNCLRSSSFTEQCLICHISDLNQGCLSKTRDEYEVLLYAKKGNFGYDVYVTILKLKNHRLILNTCLSCNWTFYLMFST